MHPDDIRAALALIKNDTDRALRSEYTDSHMALEDADAAIGRLLRVIDDNR